MKFSKKLLTVVALLAMVVISCVPATFSWYSHKQSSEGKKLNLNKDNLPVSVKSAANTFSMTTYLSDKNGEASSTTVTSVSVTSAEKVKYYKTVFTNSGTNDVMVDLEAPNMPNNADFYIGTVSPTLNEKAYASRAVRNKVTDNTVRVYFKTHSTHSSYWGIYTNAFYPDNAVGSSNGTTNDFNIAYTVGTTETLARMSQCSIADNTSDGTGRTDVYYFDVPSNATSFYFFNHWYLCSSTNREWNRTIDITNLTAGRLYYLTGGTVDGQWKEYNVRDIDTNLVAVNSYYSSVRMSYGTGVFTDIALHKTSDDENFIPEYYGQSIAYSSSNTNIAEVNKDGIITPKGYTGNSPVTITTTITGRYGDTRIITTSLSIPQYITQVPIIKNVKVAAGETVEVDWYALNNGSATMTTGNLYYTL